MIPDQPKWPDWPVLSGMNGCQLAGFIARIRARDEQQHHRDLHADDHIVEVRGLLDADHQEGRDDGR